MPLQKYGFHGLSYASIVDSLSKHLKKPAEEIDIVVAHLGSGASAACIKGGKSVDTSRCTPPPHCLLEEVTKADHDSRHGSHTP